MEMLESIRVSVASNYTIRPVRDVMQFWAKKQDYTLEILFLESFQIIPPLINVNSEFYYHGKSINIIFFRLENCYAANDNDFYDSSRCQKFLTSFVDALDFADAHDVAPLILVESPPSKQFLATDLGNTLDKHRSDFKQKINQFTNINFITQEDLFNLYPMDHYDDEFSYQSAMMPYSRECYTALGTLASRTISALIRKPYKVVVLDCDNTLWRGVVAEDGVLGLEINSSYIWFQAQMAKLYEKGVLLCLCSKNVENDIWLVFDHYKDIMPLKKHHFVSWRINWSLKSANIIDLSIELDLGLDSFIFLDDNPAEIAEVKTGCPDVQCFQLPTNSDEIIKFVKHLWELDIPKTQEMDRNRTEYYRHERRRKNSRIGFSSYEEYLSHLKLELEFLPLTDIFIGRVSQMMMRTNQFNFSGVKYSESEINIRRKNPLFTCTIISAKDCYGDYGQVGCLIYYVQEHSIYLENFMLSCRALGKKIEFMIWEWLCRFAAKKGIGEIEINFKETTRNQPANKFLLALGVDMELEKDAKHIYLIPEKFKQLSFS